MTENKTPKESLFGSLAKLIRYASGLKVFFLIVENCG